MSEIRKRSSLKVIGAAAVLGSGMLAADASANLRYDVIATAVSGAGTISGGGTQVTGVTAGSVITYKVVAVISGAAATNPGYLSGAGAVRSLTGAGLIGGNLTHTNDAAFSTGAFLSGTPYVDAAGFTQVGPTAATFNNASTGRISYLAATTVAGSGITLGTGTYTVSSLAGATSTSISFLNATTTATNKNPTWREAATSGVNASSGVIDAPTPLVISAGGVSVSPTLTLTSTAVSADITVAGPGNGNYTPTAISFTGAASGAKGIVFTNPAPGTVLVGLDLSGSASDIASLITALNVQANASGLFFGLGGGGAYDAIATFSNKTGGSFSLAWANFGNVNLQGIAVVPEPTSAMGLLGVAALAARRRRA